MRLQTNAGKDHVSCWSWGWGERSCLSPLLPSGSPGEFRARSKGTEKQTKSLEAELESSLCVLKTSMAKAVVWAESVLQQVLLTPSSSCSWTSCARLCFHRHLASAFPPPLFYCLYKSTVPSQSPILLFCSATSLLFSLHAASCFSQTRLEKSCTLDFCLVHPYCTLPYFLCWQCQTSDPQIVPGLIIPMPQNYDVFPWHLNP